MQMQKAKQGYKSVKWYHGKNLMIPETWKWSQLGKEGKLSAGATPRRDHSEYYDGEIPWVSSGELDYNVITKTNEQITSLAVEQTNLKMHSEGTFLFAITGLEAKGTRGRCALLGIKGTTNQSCMAFYESNSLIPKFLYYYYVLFGEKIIFSLAQGTKQQSLNLELSKSIKLPVPPLAEQQKIASILSNVDSLIDQTQKIIDQTQKLKKGLMQKLLTRGIGHTKFKKVNWLYGKNLEIPECWSFNGITSIIINKNGIRTGPFGSLLKKETYVQSGYKVYGQENVIPDDFTIGDYYITKEHFEKLKGCEIKPNDVLISLVGTRGKISVVPPNIKAGIINPRLLRLRFDESKALPHFMKILLESQITTIQILKYTHGLTMGILNAEILRKFVLPIPSISEQKSISDIHSVLVKKITHLEKNVQYLNTLKKGLMQKLLTGQIRVKV